MATDDTPALRTALSSLGMQGGGTLYLEPRIYTLKTQLVWPASNVSLYGDGVSRIVVDMGNQGVGIKIAAVSNVGLSGLKISGTAPDDNTALELVQVGNSVYGFSCEKVQFAYARHAGLRFVAQFPGRKARISDCTFSFIGIPGMTILKGGALQGALPFMRVRDCDFESCGNGMEFHGFYANGANDLLVDGCTFMGLNSRLHIANDGAQNYRVTGCHFEGQNRNYTWGLGNGTIAGNTFVDASLDVGCENAVVTNNTFRATRPDPRNMLQCGQPGTGGVGVRCNSFAYAGPSGGHVSGVVMTKAGNQWVVTDNVFSGLATPINPNSGSGHILAPNMIR